jgi:hypothetical protein
MSLMLGKRYVQPSKNDDGWEVVKEGHRRATVHAATQAQAVASARALARGEGGGKISVKDRTGKISDTVVVQSASPTRRSR